MIVVKIRPLVADDFSAWLPLWDGNNQGQRDTIVTAQTWARITNPEFPIYGLCATANDKMIGLVHYVLHPTTGSTRPVCYMQDVYVAPEHRRGGVARALVEEVASIGKKEKWARMYWLAESKNEAAQNLYKDLGLKLDFTLHVLPLNI